MGAAASEIFRLSRGVDLWLKQTQTMARDQFQKLVWDVFLRIVRETPQYTGRAVANWNISVGHPDMTVYVEPPDIDSVTDIPWQRGDRKWETVAWNRNRPKMREIKLTDKVFISNGVTGDVDWGDGVSTFSYIQAIQEPGKWRDRLRLENSPYESVQESLMIVTSKYMRKGLGLSGVGGNVMEESL